MRTTTYTYQGQKRSAQYACKCRGCGKELRRSVSVEHTVNPFNKNEDGSIRTAREVGLMAQAEADRKAATLEGTEVVCRQCEEAPVNELLLKMLAASGISFPEPVPFRNSAMETLLDRGYVERYSERCQCGSDCCRGYKQDAGFRLSWNGKKRAERLKAKAD